MAQTTTVLQPSKGTWGPGCEPKSVRDACDQKSGKK